MDKSYYYKIALYVVWELSKKSLKVSKNGN